MGILTKATKMTATMTSYDVKIDKLLFLTWKKPTYQILSLKNIKKEVSWSFVGQLLVIF